MHSPAIFARLCPWQPGATPNGDTASYGIFDGKSDVSLIDSREALFARTPRAPPDSRSELNLT
jgi:hypothetical protein